MFHCDGREKRRTQVAKENAFFFQASKSMMSTRETTTRTPPLRFSKAVVTSPSSTTRNNKVSSCAMADCVSVMATEPVTEDVSKSGKTSIQSGPSLKHTRIRKAGREGQVGIPRAGELFGRDEQLYGRTRERQELIDLYHSCRRGCSSQDGNSRTNVCLIGGATGTGKVFSVHLDLSFFEY